MPTAPLRTGDLRASNTIIYDPFDANGNLIANPADRKQVSCNGVLNVICANRIDPIVAKILPLIPLPNQASSSGAITEQNNYFASTPFIFDRWTLDTKVNYTPTEKLNLQFSITERANLQFRVESFNFSNTPHFSNPNGDITSTNFGRVTGALNDQRQFRFGLRLGF